KEPTYAECANPLNSGAGVDLNRNYGAFWGGIGANAAPNGQSYRGAAPFSEPEIQNMRDLFASHQVVVALSNHTPDAKVLRVPSTTDEPTPFDVAQYDSVAQLLGKDLKWDAGPWPKVYYNASGTMEEQAYYTAGTFAFTFENTPGQRGFHPAYSFVVDQYFGTGAYPGSSSRAGYMRLLEAAADPALHSVLEIKAPAGATLTLSKKIVLESAPVLLSDRDSTRGPIIKQPMELTATTVVPKGSAPFLWHVNPSSRPSQHGQELIPEKWTVTCRIKGKPVSTEVSVARGATAKVDLGKCQ
ncbi:peptidase M14, partial [bacterium]|nr:peptidase M14 [bacterium]